MSGQLFNTLCSTFIALVCTVCFPPIWKIKSCSGFSENVTTFLFFCAEVITTNTILIYLSAHEDAFSSDRTS